MVHYEVREGKVESGLLARLAVAGLVWRGWDLRKGVGWGWVTRIRRGTGGVGPCQGPRV